MTVPDFSVDDALSNARDYGISYWRILDDLPYYKIINSKESEVY